MNMNRMLANIGKLMLPLCFLSYGGNAQTRTLGYRAEIGGATSAQPFWLHADTRGKISPDTYLWGNFGLFTGYTQTDTRAFDFTFGAEGTGTLGSNKHRLFVNQLFGKIRWQNLTLQAGMWDKEEVYDGLSACNGNLLYANNTRNMPGISFATWDYLKLARWLWVKFNYDEYLMIDDRYVEKAHVHNKLLGVKVNITPQFDLKVGIEDYAQWGGKAPEGKKKYNAKDYIRLVLSMKGGSNASLSDQINVLGNHIGRYYVHLDYRHKTFEANFYYNHMYEDGSGMRFQNWQDGLYGIHLTRKDNDLWFKSFVYEFYCTKDQSGPLHDRPATEEEKAHQDPNSPFYGRIILGGMDNYLNHGEYRSGWSLYGQMIGVPFFTPAPAADGIIRGTCNNRFIAHHWGVSGRLPLWDMHYKLLCSYSFNYGTYGTPFKNEAGENITKPQFSFGFGLTVPEKKIPFQTDLRLGFDKGDLLKNRFGAMLSISKTGIF